MPEQAPDLFRPRHQLATNLAALRAQGNWSTRALAEQAQVTRSMIQLIERGRANVALETVDKLARALGVSTGSLLGPQPVARREDDNVIGVVLARNLVVARTTQKLTQVVLSERAGVSRTAVADIERQVRNPSIETLTLLSVALGMTLEALLTQSY